MNFFNRNKKILIPASILFGIIVIGTGISSYQINSDKIAKNVTVANINIGDMTRSQAINKLKKNKKFESIELNHKKMNWNVNQSDIDLEIDFNKTVENAYNLNRKKGFFSNIIKTLSSDFGNKRKIDLVMNYDKDKLKETLFKIKKELDSPVKNASIEYVNNETKIIKEDAGRDLDVKSSQESIEKSLKNNIFHTELNVKLEKAKFTTVNLKGIDTLLGTYSTVFGGMPSRDYNIKKSTYDSGNIILKSGEEYSFNTLTAEKTMANGYKSAPIIESGKLVMGIGGGVCQTSSTIFNAALLSGMEITTRRNHTIPSDYVSLGRDATVVDGNPGQDFKFKNPFIHNIYIKNYISGNKIVSEIYGSKADVKNIKISTEMLDSFGGGSKTITDPKLPAGKKVVEKYARPGYSVVTYRIYLDEKNNVIKTEKIGLSTYPSQQGIVRVGAGTVKPANQTQKTNSLPIQNSHTNTVQTQ